VSYLKKIKEGYNYYIGNLQAEMIRDFNGTLMFANMLKNGGLADYGVQTQISVIHPKGIFRLADIRWDKEDIIELPKIEEENDCTPIKQSSPYLERPKRKPNKRAAPKKKKKELTIDDIDNATFNFGKYKGVRIKDIPTNYLMWLYEVPYFYDATKITAEQREAAMIKIRPLLAARDLGNLHTENY